MVDALIAFALAYVLVGMLAYKLAVTFGVLDVSEMVNDKGKLTDNNLYWLLLAFWPLGMVAALRGLISRLFK